MRRKVDGSDICGLNVGGGRSVHVKHREPSKSSASTHVQTSAAAAHINPRPLFQPPQHLPLSAHKRNAKSKERIKHKSLVQIPQRVNIERNGRVDGQSNVRRKGVDGDHPQDAADEALAVWSAVVFQVSPHGS